MKSDFSLATMRLILAALVATCFIGFPSSVRAAEGDAAKLTFEMYQDAAGQYRWRLKSANGNVLAVPGQGYVAKADCKHAIDSIKENAASTKQTFETYQDSKQEHRWRLKSSNGQTIATSSEGYKVLADCEKAIDTIKKGAKDAEIVEAPAP
jgi:uncharacterized protein YegP (UPF0339 family)